MWLLSESQPTPVRSPRAAVSAPSSLRAMSDIVPL